MHKKVFIFLFDGFSDWEIAFLSPEIKKSQSIELIYFSSTGQAVSSMGGLQVMPNVSLEQIDPQEVDLLVLPGGSAWERNKNNEIETLVKSLVENKKSIAAICAATTYLGKLGLLNQIKHTSNALHYLQSIAPQYTGAVNYTDALATSSRHIITANGIAPIEFAKEIFLQLELYDLATIEKWFQLFKNGIWKV
ncbi:DJ-1/PfpI family protein [Aureispira sp. CCB-QB1]|uniref:DJ-1/PfpI family protein n=1 Tax=Aureispira sp. CCB-QB1 TaxID=1313421 RepID=UPI000697331B|nr:DJ-1/PfpI family protein [Aureispira sp. CCB-QB1]